MSKREAKKKKDENEWTQYASLGKWNTVIHIIEISVNAIENHHLVSIKETTSKLSQLKVKAKSIILNRRLVKREIVSVSLVIRLKDIIICIIISSSSPISLKFNNRCSNESSKQVFY